MNLQQRVSSKHLGFWINLLWPCALHWFSRPPHISQISLSWTLTPLSLSLSLSLSLTHTVHSFKQNPYFKVEWSEPFFHINFVHPLNTIFDGVSVSIYCQRLSIAALWCCLQAQCLLTSKETCGYVLIFGLFRSFCLVDVCLLQRSLWLFVWCTTFLLFSMQLSFGRFLS